MSFRSIEGSETLWWRGESYKMLFSSLLTLHSRHSALPRCPESILATGSASHFDSFLYLRIRKTFMRRTHQHSFTRFPQSPLVSSRFKEHLSIAIPPLDSDLFHERSYIFPESPTGCGIPSGGLIFSHRSSPCTRSLDLENSSTGDSNSSPQRLVQHSVRDRLARLFPVLRLSRTRNGDTPVKRPVWRHGQGPVHCDCRVQPSAQTRRQVWHRRALHSARHLSALPVQQCGRPRRRLVYSVAGTATSAFDHFACACESASEHNYTLDQYSTVHHAVYPQCTRQSNKVPV